jgi:hypothetical protein
MEEKTYRDEGDKEISHPLHPLHPCKFFLNPVGAAGSKND